MNNDEIYPLEKGAKFKYSLEILSNNRFTINYAIVFIEVDKCWQ